MGRVWAIACLTLGAVLGLGAGCREQPGGADSPTATDAGKPVVYTSFYPMAYMARRIAGEHAEIVCPVPEGGDPASGRPSREVIAAYRDADLIVLNGAGFEDWVATASLPGSRVVETAARFEDEWLQYETTTHAHGPGGEHTHEGIDGHTWLDPVNARRQAEAIRDAMIERLDAPEAALRRNFAALASDLEALDARLEGLAERLEGVQLMAAHPAYNYLSARYGWEITSLDLDPAGPVGDDSLAAVADAADPAARVRVMLWESAPAESVAAALSEAAGVRSVVFSPAELLGAGARRAGEDYLSVMHANVDRLEEAVGGS